MLTHFEQQILELINEHRQGIGKESLNTQEAIQHQCHYHSESMALGAKSFGHSGFEARAQKLAQEINALVSAENVAYGQSSAQQVVQDWLNSPGHRKNIEGDYNHTGIAAVQDGQGQYYFTQIFCKIDATNPLATQQLSQELFLSINKHREILGLNPLRLNPFLTELAQGHSNNIAQGLYSFSHEGFEKRLERIKEFIGISKIAENIAMGTNTPQQILNSWLNSPAHRKNIEGNFFYTGLAVAQDTKTNNFYITQIFILPQE